jgi:hypothetical protein
MDSVEEKNFEVKNMSHDMVKETHNVETADSDSGDMYRMGKDQQFKVRFKAQLGVPLCWLAC